MVARVKPGDRENHSATNDGRFPIHSKSQAESALKLRGHHTTKAQRRSIIRRAAKYVPDQVKDALEEDQKNGKV